MRETKSLDAIMDGFDPNGPERAESMRDRRPVTIWISASAKARYDRLQQSSGRTFSKMAREILLMAIEKAEARAS